MLDPEIATLLDVVNATESMATMTPVQAREGFRALTVRAPVIDVEVGDDRVAGLAARVYRPREASYGVVVLFHGGGFVIGDLDTHDHMARSICAGTSAVVIAVDYRLAPENPWPAAVEDALAAVTDVLARASSYGDGPVAVAGDSAGGNLSAVVAQHLPVAAQFLIYPAVDMSGDYPSRTENGDGYFLDLPTMSYFVGHYLADDVDLTDPRLSPIAGVRPGLPPAVVITAEYDPLRDEGIAYAEALDREGASVVARTYPGMIHGFFDMGVWSVAARAAVDDAIGLFAQVLRDVAAG